MMIPEFMRFYKYTASDALNEFAVTFFSLMNSMYRLQARESLNQMVVIGAAVGGDGGTVSELQKQEKGLHGVIQEVRTINKVRGK